MNLHIRPFSFTAALSHPIYCLILPSFPVPHTPTLRSFGAQLFPLKGGGLGAITRYRMVNETEKDREVKGWASGALSYTL